MTTSLSGKDCVRFSSTMRTSDRGGGAVRRGGVEQAQAHRPEVVVMDIAMRELNGIEATVQIIKRRPTQRC